MAIVEVEIPENEYQALSKIAQKLGLSVVTLIQQELDNALTTVSAWIQRAQE